MPQSRFNRILQEAYSAFCTAGEFYAREARTSDDQINKLFLYFLSAKRRAQQIELQLTARKYGITLYPQTNAVWNSFYHSHLRPETLDKLLDFAHEKAELEMKHLERMSQPDDEIQTRSLLQSLKNMIRDYFFDINTGYLIFVSRKYSPEKEYANRVDEKPELAIF